MELKMNFRSLAVVLALLHNGFAQESSSIPSQEISVVTSIITITPSSCLAFSSPSTVFSFDSMSESDTSSSASAQPSGIVPIDGLLNAGNEFNLEFPGFLTGGRKRAPIRTYLQANGNTTTNPDLAVKFKLTEEGYLKSTNTLEVLWWSTELGIKWQLFDGNNIEDIGFINRTFYADGGFLRWTSQWFPNVNRTGNATFYRDPPGQLDEAQVYAVFDPLHSIPSSWERIGATPTLVGSPTIPPRTGIPATYTEMSAATGSAIASPEPQTTEEPAVSSASEGESSSGVTESPTESTDEPAVSSMSEDEPSSGVTESAAESTEEPNVSSVSEEEQSSGVTESAAESTEDPNVSSVSEEEQSSGVTESAAESTEDPGASSISEEASSGVTESAAQSTEEPNASSASEEPSSSASERESVPTIASKRGLAYMPNDLYPEDDQVWIQTGSQVGWYVNFRYKPTKEFYNHLQFVPMLAGDYEENSFVEYVQDIIEEGWDIDDVLGYFLPDVPISGGGNEISPQDAAGKWKTDINPLGQAGIRIGGPTVMGTGDGINWLKDFFEACDNQCIVDFLKIYWYPDLEGVPIDQVLETFIGEFPNYNTYWVAFEASGEDYDTNSFAYTNAINYLQDNPFVERIAYTAAVRSYKSKLTPYNALLSSCGVLTAIGSDYVGIPPGDVGQPSEEPCPFGVQDIVCPASDGVQFVDTNTNQTFTVRCNRKFTGTVIEGSGGPFKSTLRECVMACAIQAEICKSVSWSYDEEQCLLLEEEDSDDEEDFNFGGAIYTGPFDPCYNEERKLPDAIPVPGLACLTEEPEDHVETIELPFEVEMSGVPSSQITVSDIGTIVLFDLGVEFPPGYANDEGAHNYLPDVAMTGENHGAYVFYPFWVNMGVVPNLKNGIWYQINTEGENSQLLMEFILHRTDNIEVSVHYIVEYDTRNPGVWNVQYVKVHPELQVDVAVIGGQVDPEASDRFSQLVNNDEINRIADGDWVSCDYTLTEGRYVICTRISLPHCTQVEGSECCLPPLRIDPTLALPVPNLACRSEDDGISDGKSGKITLEFDVKMVNGGDFIIYASDRGVISHARGEIIYPEFEGTSQNVLPKFIGKAGVAFYPFWDRLTVIPRTSTGVWYLATPDSVSIEFLLADPDNSLNWIHFLATYGAINNDNRNIWRVQYLTVAPALQFNAGLIGAQRYNVQNDPNGQYTQLDNYDYSHRLTAGDVVECEFNPEYPEEDPSEAFFFQCERLSTLHCRDVAC